MSGPERTDLEAGASSAQPTLRATLLLLAGVPVALVPVLLGAELWTVWLLFAAASALLIGIDALLLAHPASITIAALAPSLLYIGDEDPLHIDLTSALEQDLELEVLLDLSPELEPQPAIRVRLPARGSVRIEAPLRPTRRGTARLEAVWLRYPGALGLARRVVRRPVGHPFAVVPNVRAVKVLALRFFGSRELLSGLKVERYLGDGSEFESLREYVPGFDVRAIDWRATARHHKLVVREFRAERNHQVVLAFDTGHLMAEPLEGIPRLDHAVNAGLVLGWLCLKTGDRVGTYGFHARPGRFTEPLGGIRAFARVQSHLAELEDRPDETNFTLGVASLLGRLKRRSLVCVFTDFSDSVTAELLCDNMGRLARRHVVLFIALRDPLLARLAEAPPEDLDALHRAVVAEDLLRERARVLRRLQQLAVHVIDAPPGGVTMDLLNRYLDIKRRELV